MRTNIQRTFTVFMYILIATLAIITTGCHKQSKAVVVSGEVEARQIDVASKIPARIDSFTVHEGTVVQKGQVLAHLVSPDMDAKLKQAEGAVKSAQAMLDMAKNGARAEDIEAARQAYEAAKAQSELADKSLARIKNLYEKNSVTAQAYDDIVAKQAAAKAQMKAAAEIWIKAKNGARREEISTAQGNYDRAVSALEEVNSYLAETTVIAPLAAEVQKLVYDPGELAGTGLPIVTLVDLSDIWVTLYLTEDKMPGLTMGKVLEANIPALGSNSYQFKVDYINPAGEFATRKAVMEQGGFDLKSFELHLRPVQPINGLRPGMSARITL